jgi:hypothetical protein
MWHDWHALRSIVRRTNREATRPDHELADLRTRFLPLRPEEAWRHVQSAVDRLANNGGGWSVEEESPDGDQVRLVRRRMLRFSVSDVTVSLWPMDSPAGPLVAVDVVSVGRGGPIDFGQNARNVRDFYRALEAVQMKCQVPSAKCQVEDGHRALGIGHRENSGGTKARKRPPA